MVGDEGLAAAFSPLKYLTFICLAYGWTGCGASANDGRRSD